VQALWVGVVPVLWLLYEDRASSTPEDVSAVDAAFDDCLRELGLKRRADPVVDSLAKKMFELAKKGERDRIKLCEATLNWVRGNGS
jgi:hypothetical protein